MHVLLVPSQHRKRLVGTTCRVAHQHFTQVEPGRRDGLLYTIAGIQDLNILFSNIAFMVVLRAFIQVMEAGIQDPALVVWLQVCSP
jgi:hypothetical protein